ncbi:hypothetical protein EPIR_3702 [Erwinia piriflorinigrans CFBP 5888]|uniref:Uncharacterized protein n=1 Tax=Erwinia piriflorinigrans CFBP 5888 TaxID=1161919 RepID=V5ZCT7_9GAMM|nr:hypothetical protein EPIR_3702 [Erwinia piriflorinigrans CFBP 5888]
MGLLMIQHVFILISLLFHGLKTIEYNQDLPVYL